MFVIVARRKFVALIVVGIHRYVYSIGRKDILRYLASISKPHCKNMNNFRGIMEIRLPQSKNRLRGTSRKRVCQVIHVFPKIFANISCGVDIRKQGVKGII